MWSRTCWWSSRCSELILSFWLSGWPESWWNTWLLWLELTRRPLERWGWTWVNFLSCSWWLLSWDRYNLRFRIVLGWCCRGWGVLFIFFIGCSCRWGWFLLMVFWRCIHRCFTIIRCLFSFGVWESWCCSRSRELGRVCPRFCVCCYEVRLSWIIGLFRCLRRTSCHWLLLGIMAKTGLTIPALEFCAIPEATSSQKVFLPCSRHWRQTI